MRLTEADVEAMAESDLHEALSLIGKEIKRREEGGFAEVVRAYLHQTAESDLRELVKAGGGAVALTFPTGRWDNGWFYDEHWGELKLADGTTVKEDFYHTTVHDALTELSEIARRDGGLDSDSQLAVDLRTGEVVHR